MQARRDPTFLVPTEPHFFHPEDLAIMRHAYNAACQERPGNTEDQRLVLAKAIVVAYRSDLSEEQLVATVLNLAG